MRKRSTGKWLALGLALAAAGIGSQIAHAVTSATCVVRQVGWREDMKSLKIECTSGEVFWTPEATANASCTYKASYEAIKMWQASANASFLSGKALVIWYETQDGCNKTDKVPREIYLGT